MQQGTRVVRRWAVNSRRKQAGVALLALLTLLTLWGLYLFVGQLNATQFKLAREQSAAAAMAEAKAALIGDAIARSPVSDAGYLRLPDLGSKLVDGEWVPAEGGPSVSFPDNDENHTVVGKFPWKRTTVGHIGTGVLRDAQGECLWYMVSGRFKIVPKTGQLNWDTQGQIEIMDPNGTIVATSIAALVVAPGRALDGQSRALADAAYTECGGNYDARNYLDSFDIGSAIGGNVNYFPGSKNNRVAASADSKRFVMADTEHYNDRVVLITVHDIFDALIRRNDFKVAIGNLLDDPDLRKRAETVHPGSTVEISSGAGKEKGTANLVALGSDPTCDYINDLNNRKFCRNWNEMLFLTTLPTPSPITIDGAQSPVCSRVLIFAGRRAAGQSRASAAERANKDNYLEATNASSFSVPTATANTFRGKSEFDWRNPSADIVRCLP
jgi:hypothetical protein